ncbi:zinc finger protein [Saccharopolyspora mangrovi]|uniref:Zinc finger protein n=1 Tax=Saccharopolyspora mangrovi TaxID=3082379 RepID=A0ABU6AIG2_9PSEU|nr:zinc finger protein [Saccharopolyspora sp. S2-29]MEB3371174.1 zinc finger protein [Saccharopolyspora sp. S2-29]
MFKAAGVDWFWRPIGDGRHAFHADAKSAEPEDSVKSYCGVEVEAVRVQRIPGEIAWITEETCMDCWRTIAERNT